METLVEILVSVEPVTVGVGVSTPTPASVTVGAMPNPDPVMVRGITVPAGQMCGSTSLTIGDGSPTVNV
jgi:hypothetical protein